MDRWPLIGGDGLRGLRLPSPLLGPPPLPLVGALVSAPGFCFFHLVRRFWNHIFTWVSVKLKDSARLRRSHTDRYLVDLNLFSRATSCSYVNAVRALLGLPDFESEPERLRLGFTGWFSPFDEDCWVCCPSGLLFSESSSSCCPNSASLFPSRALLSSLHRSSCSSLSDWFPRVKSASHSSDRNTNPSSVETQNTVVKTQL